MYLNLILKAKMKFDAFERNAERIFRNWAENQDYDITDVDFF